MNTKILVRSAFSITAAMLLLGACKKDEDDTPPVPTASEKIVGTWKIAFNAGDDNGNKTLDQSERVPEGSDYDTKLTFQTNGGLNFVSKFQGAVTDSGTGTWSIVGDDYLRYTLPAESASVKLHTLDASNLIVEDTSMLIAEWTGYVKQ